MSAPAGARISRSTSRVESVSPLAILTRTLSRSMAQCLAMTCEDLLAQDGDEVGAANERALVRQQDLQPFARQGRRVADAEELQQFHAAFLPNSMPNRLFLSRGNRDVEALAAQAAGGLHIGLGGRALRVVQRHRGADVGGPQHVLALRDDAEQRDGQDLEHVLGLQHVAALGAGVVVAGEEQEFLHPLAALGLARSWNRAGR